MSDQAGVQKSSVEVPKDSIANPAGPSTRNTAQTTAASTPTNATSNPTGSTSNDTTTTGPPKDTLKVETIVFDKIVVKRLAKPSKETKNSTFKSLASGQKDEEKTFRISNINARTFMYWIENQTIEFAQEARLDSRGAFSGELGGSSSLKRFLNVIQPPVKMVALGAVRPPKTTDSPLEADLIGFGVVTPLGSKGKTLKFTTQASALKDQFGDICAGKSGLYISPGHLILGLARTHTKDDTIGLSDLIELSGVHVPTWIRPVLDVVEAIPKYDESNRSAVWILGGVTFDAFIRVEMQLKRSDDDTGINKFINKYAPSLKLNNITVVVKRNFCQAVTSHLRFEHLESSEIWLQAPVMEVNSAGGKANGAMLSIGLGSNALRLSLQWSDAGSSISSIRDWLNSRLSSLGGGDGLMPDLTSIFKDSFSSAPGKKSWLDCLHMRSINIDIGEKSIYGASIMMEVDLPFGAPKGDFNTIILSAQMEKKTFIFTGMLQGEDTWQSQSLKSLLDPNYEKFNSLESFPPRPGCQKAIYLQYLDPDNPLDPEDIPTWLPSKITDLFLQLQYSPGGIIIRFHTVVETTERISGDVPVFEISQLGLAVEIRKPRNGTRSIDILFTGTVDMYKYGTKVEDGALPSGTLNIAVQYQTPGSWYLRGSIEGLRMTALASFFDGDAAAAITEIFKNIFLHDLSLEYTLIKGAPSTLAINAFIVIANVQFIFSYTHYGKTKKDVKSVGGGKTKTDQKSPPVAQENKQKAETGGINWLISADARLVDGAIEENPKIRDWIADIVDEDLAADLPEFVGNTEIPLDTLAASIKCFSVDNYTFFVFRLSIKGFGFEFAQIKDNSDASLAPATSKGGEGNTRPKNGQAIRLLRIKLDGFPDCGNLPLVGEVKQPLEEIDFLWINQFLTRKYAILLNEYVFIDPDDKLLWKEPIAKGGTQDVADIVIAAGFHFMVIMSLDIGPTVILDYLFGQKSPSKDSKSTTAGTGTVSKSTPSKAVMPSSSTTVSSDKSPESDESKPSAPAPFEKKVGPLSISNLSLKYKDQILTIIFNADVKLGPLEFALKGFSISLHLKGVSLHNLSKLEISASLSGLGMEVKQGKIILAGLFERIEDEQISAGYVGGLSICLPQYTFLGAGGYLEDRSGFKSVFGILMVTGPLMHFGFAEVRGITGGFGYNSTLRIPTLNELDSFPLLNQTIPSGKGPLAQLSGIMKQGWIRPKKDTIWIAAGLTVKAFQVVDVQAVVTVEVGDDLKIAIVGRAVATAPPQSAPEKAFVLVVLDVVASIDFGKGAFSLQAQLNPSSFILDKACHPTGGFALCSWFGNSQYAGDWVFTIGGFHPAYARPAHYPNPPRLGISWKYDRSISITGEAYFAITPKLCMGGGKLSINFDVGCISAYLTAYADFLINYEPFQYMICVGVKIGVSFTLKLLFIRAKFSVEVSAQITIEGPPVSGKVYVNLKVISFTIAFGARRSTKKPLTLPEFWELLVQSSKGEDKSNHIFGVAAGLIPTGKPKEGHLGSLRAGVLDIQIHSRAAISQINLGKLPTCKSDLASEIYAKPTRVKTRLVSNIEATVVREGSPRVDESEKFRITPIYKHVPSALWTCYNEAEDPSDDKANTQALRSSKAATYNHLMGFSITPREPTLSPDKLPKFSVDDLLEASSAGNANIKSPQKTATRFLPGLKGATKSKLRGVWGGNTTTTPVNINKVLMGFNKGLESITKKESSYANLPTAAPKQMFDDFDLIYSSGAPRLAASQDNQPPDLVGGEWSTKWEKSSAYKIESVNRSSIDLEKYAKGIVAKDPKIHFGINRIDYQKSPSYRFNTFVKFLKYEKTRPTELPDTQGKMSEGKVMTIGAHSWSGSVLNECDVTWLAIFGNQKNETTTDIQNNLRIQTGLCPIGETSSAGLIRDKLGVIGPDNCRIITQEITFEQPYKEVAPRVIVWLTSVNVTGPGNPKFKAEAKDIKPEGCKIVFTIWGGGAFEGISCSWLAHPARSRRIQTGVFSTLDLRGAYSPRKITTDRVSFENFKFERTPTLLVAFNHIECNCDHDFRAGVTVSDVKTNGFTWHCSTWGFTDLHVASAAYVAFDA
ncbi:hypothetical protein H072_6331 [Dactylellina haptotyla CBS 200.50]|uniref:Uncharacterized protein n=1 Tax=Dactylellina haptotyla (strain CBS 200.50) TaxID=1284197 RepID=S8BXF3_DACHA|nr:hypothetical protein H072_6331 [Dactylellina haptotyla CBS 200.50]